jgi:rhodanese-related sulfurtransferase
VMNAFVFRSFARSVPLFARRHSVVAPRQSVMLSSVHSRAPVTIRQRQFASSAASVIQKSELEGLLIQQDVNMLLLDVRQPKELAHGVIPSGKNVPLDELDSALKLSAAAFLDRYGFHKPEPSLHVVCYCRTGVRSEAAAQLLIKAGFTRVQNYRGSFADWFGHVY